MVLLRVYPIPARNMVTATGFEGEAVVVDVLVRRVAVLQVGSRSRWPGSHYAVRAGAHVAVFMLVK